MKKPGPIKKPGLRTLLASGTLLALFAAAVFVIHPTRDGAQPEWPYTAVEGAETVSLSRARRLLDTNPGDRRAGILGNHIYIAPIPLPESTSPAGPPSGAVQARQTPETPPPSVKALLPYPPHEFITSLVETSAVDVRIYKNPDISKSWIDRLIQVLPVLVILLLVVFLLSRGITKSLGLNSAYEVIETEKLDSGFQDVAGIDTARDELQEIVSFLKDPDSTSRLGGRMPKGALFAGSPGTGKTLLARAMAKEAGVPFYSIDASSVSQFFVGAGASKIRKAFRDARKRAPCIIFIDEIDAMGRKRNASSTGASDEKETTLNSLLVELDGFSAREGVVVIAATNRPEVLDPALTRRGRIDRRIHIDLPDHTGRSEILSVHARKIKIAGGLDLTAIAANTLGFSGADLAALCNEAALMATRADRATVSLDDFRAARDRMLVGLSGAGRHISAEERRITAVHEAGHALIAATAGHADPIEKATVLPQGGAVGFVMQAPTEDRVFETRARLRARIRVAVAGREAERLVFGEDAITSGAAADIEAATRVAREMVTRYGMSGQGFIRIDPNDANLFDTASPPVKEISALIAAEATRARATLEASADCLLAIADALESRETLLGEEIRQLVATHAVAETAGPTEAA